MLLALGQSSARQQLLPSLRLDAVACPGFGVREDVLLRAGFTFAPAKENA